MATNRPEQFKLPANAITKVHAHTLTNEGLVCFVQAAEQGIQLVNPATVAIPFDAILQIAAQIMLWQVQMKNMQKMQPLPGNLPLPPGFGANGRKPGG